MTDITADSTAAGQAGTAADAPVFVKRRMPFRRWFRTVGWRHLVGLVALAFALFPVLFVVSSSLNPAGTLGGSTLIPSDVSFINYRDLLNGTDAPYLDWLVNTLFVAGGAAVLNTGLAAFASYAFSRMRFAGRRSGLLAILLIQMFPTTLLFVALFVFVTDIGGVFPGLGLGSRTMLLIIYLGGALGINTWLIKGYFDTIPRDLDESALIDGATHAQIFFRVILPLAAPILAVVALITFVFTINEFVVASVVLGQGDDNNFTLAVGMFRFIDGQGGEWGQFAAGSVMSAIPVVLLFLFLQRWIVSGLTAGAVKG
ncbi:MAG: sugar ABC transporter permease [Ilumatobacter sp.]|nr:sugar ABC transporter permease [Ilumatobacter sp.]MDJ0771133.1 sugar ABC transporter permease [Ilumatobacter sp.]